MDSKLGLEPADTAWARTRIQDRVLHRGIFHECSNPPWFRAGNFLYVGTWTYLPTPHPHRSLGSHRNDRPFICSTSESYIMLQSFHLLKIRICLIFFAQVSHATWSKTYSPAIIPRIVLPSPKPPTDPRNRFRPFFPRTWRDGSLKNKVSKAGLTKVWY
jgi:hypothetical protein